MSKSDRIKQKHAEEQQRVVQEAGKASLSRRKFIRNLGITAAGIGLTGGGALLYKSHQSDDGEPQAPTVPEPLDPNYISLAEAMQIYRDLSKRVQEKWEEAKRQNKPLRIFVLEDHESANSLAYELMLTDIANRLGVKTLLTEIGASSVETLLNEDSSKLTTQRDPVTHERSFQAENKQKLFQFATRHAFEIKKYRHQIFQSD